MYSLIKSLFALLTAEQRRRFYGLQALVILMAFAEIVGIASIVPFMALVGDISLLEGDGLYAALYALSGIKSPEAFLFISGCIVLTTLSIGTMLSTLTNWKLSLFAVSVGTQIGDRLYSHYMYQPWLFHSTHSSAQLTKQISTEAVRITEQILYPLMLLNARVVLVTFIAGTIFAYKPAVAVVGLSLFGGAYIILFKLVRARLQRNSRQISELSTTRFRLMNEGFGGIKDVTLLGRQADMTDQFTLSGHQFAYAQGTNNALAQVPRYFMELLAFGSIIGLILFLMHNEQGRLSSILPTLSVYALAGFKLLPALQQIYWGFSSIKGAQGAFEAVRNDLLASQKTRKIHNTATDSLQPKTSIEIKNVQFSYPGKMQTALNDLNLNIKANTTVGIVGPSGSGKSTAIDLLLGLIEPERGQLLIDGQEITSENRRAWQNCIGYVPQNIFLSEGSIAENVAFGVPASEIDRVQVSRALHIAHLDELVGKLPQGIDTRVGERGVQLSGGQRQRIGIARALYHDPCVLIFDEATSALDGLTEKIIMEAINNFSGQKTIIMIAHRLKTVKQCDVLFYLKDGQVTHSGTYQKILDENPEFRNMAQHA